MIQDILFEKMDRLVKRNYNFFETVTNSVTIVLTEFIVN